ncbi:hypothetical protein [Cereibacter sphaeroides]|uniref:hypothetical protein n=1 Tax=Cereibacter sphaeroides TaxID=1063 RepID=UPI0039A1B0BE
MDGNATAGDDEIRIKLAKLEALFARGATADERAMGGAHVHPTAGEYRVHDFALDRTIGHDAVEQVPPHFHARVAGMPIRLSASKWKSARTTNAVERLNEKFRRRVKTHPDRVAVLAERHLELPVQRVLDRPMGAHGRQQDLGCR